MPAARHVFLILGLVSAAIALFLLSNAQVIRVDACLDAGGSYDYQRRLCDHEVSHPAPDVGN